MHIEELSSVMFLSEAGEPEQTVARLQLDIGSIYLAPKSGTIYVETPVGAAYADTPGTILRVSYNPQSASGKVTYLVGICMVNTEEGGMMLAADQVVALGRGVALGSDEDLPASGRQAGNRQNSKPGDKTQPPTQAAIDDPTKVATQLSTQTLTKEPSEVPTKAPTQVSTKAPTQVPTNTPTEVPTQAPTKAPTQISTKAPTEVPTQASTKVPTKIPTQELTKEPTKAPTQALTSFPTKAPTKVPTQVPTQVPTKEPTQIPTPTKLPIEGDNVYFVSPSGSDDNPGTLAEPWETISWAVNKIKAGDTLYIREGVYVEHVVVYTSGTKDQPIRILAYPGERPVMDGNQQLPKYWVGLFSIRGEYVQVSGIEVRNSAYDAFGLYGNHNMVDNVLAHGCQYRGILIKSNYSIVQNSRIWGNSLVNENSASPKQWSSGVSAGEDFESDNIADYAVIRNNIVWGNWGEGVSTFNARGTIIEGNTIYDNWSANLYVSDAQNITVQRNFVYTTGAMAGGTQVGIMMGDEVYLPASKNIVIVNNIVYNANRNFYWWKGVQGGGMNNVLVANNTFVNSVGTSNVKIQAGTHNNVNFFNNIIQQDDNLPILQLYESDEELRFSNNVWSKEPPAAGLGSGDIVGDPRLIKTGSPYSPAWFKLSDTSPALDHAVVLPEVVVDYFSKPRDNSPDAGALEH